MDVTLVVYRQWTERFEDEAGRLALHHERAKMLHGLVDALGLEVTDWGETDSHYPREFVELIVALAPIFVPPLVAILTVWMKERKFKQITIKRPDGTKIDVRGYSPSQLKAVQEFLEAVQGSENVS